MRVLPALFLLLPLLGACARTAPPPIARAPSIGEANPAIRSARVDGDTLAVVADIDAWDGASLVEYPAVVVRDVGRALRPGRIEHVDFRFRASHRPLFDAAFDAAALRAAPYDDLGAGGVLGMARIVAPEGPAARAAIAAWCAANPDGRVFCNRALG